MRKIIPLMLVTHLLSSGLLSGAIKPTRTFVDYAKHIEWYGYSKHLVAKSLRNNVARGLVAAGATGVLASVYAQEEDTLDTAQKAAQGAPVSAIAKADRAGSAFFALAMAITACIAVKSGFNCWRLNRIMKHDALPKIHNGHFQASMLNGMQPSGYYWVPKPYKNLFL